VVPPAVNVIVSPTHTGSALTVIVPPVSEPRCPRMQPSQTCVQHVPSSQQLPLQQLAGGPPQQVPPQGPPVSGSQQTSQTPLQHFQPAGQHPPSGPGQHVCPFAQQPSGALSQHFSPFAQQPFGDHEQQSPSVCGQHMSSQQSLRQHTESFSQHLGLTAATVLLQHSPPGGSQQVPGHGSPVSSSQQGAHVPLQQISPSRQQVSPQHRSRLGQHQSVSGQQTPLQQNPSLQQMSPGRQHLGGCTQTPP